MNRFNRFAVAIYLYSEQHFLYAVDLLSAGQGEYLVLIIGCHSELSSQGCTFCFQKHPLISPFAHREGQLNTLLLYLALHVDM